MNSQKQKKHSMLRRAISVALMSSLCLTAAIGVATFTQTVTVSDVTSNVAEETEGENKNSVIEGYLTEESVSDSMLDAFKVESNVEKVVESSLNMVVKENDSEAFAGAAKEEQGEEIRIENWCKVKVDLRGEKLDKEVPAGTVSDALAYLGIKLGEKDKLVGDQKAQLKDGMEITIQTVEIKKTTKTETIDYETVNKETSTLYEGNTDIETYGQEGERTITYQETWVNGKLKEKKEISSEVTKEAVDQVVLVGTAKYEESVTASDSDDSYVSVDESSNTITDKNGNVLHYSYCLSGPTTAYTAEYGAGTATGRLARYGVVAVDPDEIPYGSVLYIVADDGFVYGYAVAGDTGGFIYYTDVVADLYFPTFDDCSFYGLRDAHVYVLEGVSEDMTYYN